MGLSRTLDMLKGSVCSSSWYQLAEDGGHAPQRRGAAPSLSKRGRPLGRFILQTQNGGRRRSCPGSAERARAGFQPGTAPRRLCLPKENGPRAGILARTPRFEASYGINSTTRRKAGAPIRMCAGLLALRVRCVAVYASGAGKMVFSPGLAPGFRASHARVLLLDDEKMKGGLAPPRLIRSERSQSPEFPVNHVGKVDG